MPHQENKNILRELQFKEKDMECKTKFNDFITNISLNDEMKSELRKAYKQLRANLNSHEISKEIITTFLQGSYALSLIHI